MRMRKTTTKEALTTRLMLVHFPYSIKDHRGAKFQFAICRDVYGIAMQLDQITLERISHVKSQIDADTVEGFLPVLIGRDHAMTHLKVRCRS